MAIVKFGKVTTVGSSGLTAGKIYFETSTGLIKVAKSATEVDVFGSNVKDATYSGNVLTITKSDGNNITLNFSDIASASGVMTVFNEIKSELADKVDVTPGSRLMTDAEGTKLEGIAEGAQVNVIESITVNGEKVSVTGKAAAIPNAGADTYGAITENRVKALAGEVAGSVYKVKGTKATIDDVLAVGTAAVGDVYNVTAAFTLNEQKFPAGTNVVFVGPGEEGEPDPAQQAQWDALGGTVDLTPYETTAHAAATYATKETVSALDERVDTVEGQVATKAEQSAVDTLSGKVDTNTAAIGVLNGLESATGSVAHTAKGIVDREITALDLANTYETKGAAAGVKATIDAYKVNDIAISTNPTLTGDNVKLSTSYVAVEEYSAPAIGDKIDAAIAKLAKGIEDAAAGGVQSIGGATGTITVKGGGSTNGDINLTMSGKELRAAIVGLKSAAFAESSSFDIAGAAAAVLGTDEDTSEDLTVYGVKARVDEGIQAVQQVEYVSKGTDGEFVTTTVSGKIPESAFQSIGVSVKIQDINSASDSNKGLLEAYNAKTYIDSKVSESITWEEFD